MLDAQSQATLDIRVQRGIDMVNECWGTEIGPDDEDFQTAAKDAISDILTACFGPAGKIVPASDGDGYTKVTNADAYADASALADAGAESYYGDGEDYVEAPNPFPVTRLGGPEDPGQVALDRLEALEAFAKRLRQDSIFSPGRGLFNYAEELDRLLDQ